jgi:bacterioferritin
MSKDPEKMLRFDLEDERVTIINYRRGIRQAEAMGEYALGEVLRQIIAQEQDHLIDLAGALGIEAPHVGDGAKGDQLTSENERVTSGRSWSSGRRRSA